MAKNQKTPKMSKNTIFHVFRGYPQKRSKTPRGGGGVQKGGPGGPGGPKKGVRGGPPGGSRGGRFWGSPRGNALKMGVNPTPARAPQRDFWGKTGLFCMGDPQNRQTWVEKMTDFRRKISPFPPAEKYGAKCPKNLSENPYPRGPKKVPFFNVPSTQFAEPLFSSTDPQNRDFLWEIRGLGTPARGFFDFWVSYSNPVSGKM